MNTSQVTCILPVKDMARARRFYEGQLELKPVGEAAAVEALLEPA